MSTLKGLNSRYSSADWLAPCDIILVGLGSVGHGTALSLLANGYNLVAYDYDTVSIENVIPQGYSTDQTGILKTEAFLRNANMFLETAPVVYNCEYNGMVAEVMISAVDNMRTRKQIFEAFLSSDEAKLFIDARMIPCQFEIYCVTKDERKIKDYMTSLFEDNEIPEQNCSFKSSRHTNQIIQGMITSFVCNYVANREKQLEVYDVPFKYSFNSNYLGLCNFQS